MKKNAKGDKPFSLNAHVSKSWRCEDGIVMKKRNRGTYYTGRN